MSKGMKAFFGIVSASPVLFLLGMIVSFLLYLAIPVRITNTVGVQNGLLAAGSFLILVGTLLAFAAQKVSRVVTNPKYKATCPDLMQGPYQYSRHPGSLSLVIMYLGFALIVNSIAMICFAFVMLMLLTLVFIPAEEKVIGELCPEAYAEYKTKVRMWI
jgi:protein-S-isoprenylcysteine O-methyltransferase Ste14